MDCCCAVATRASQTAGRSTTWWATSCTAPSWCHIMAGESATGRITPTMAMWKMMSLGTQSQSPSMTQWCAAMLSSTHAGFSGLECCDKSQCLRVGCPAAAVNYREEHLILLQTLPGSRVIASFDAAGLFREVGRRTSLSLACS